MKEKFLAVDLFSGIGCASLGFARAKFKVAASLEIDDMRCENYEIMLGKRPMQEDIAAVNGADLLTAAGLKKGENFCLVGCPPCQSFSKLSKTRGISALKDPRSHYVLKFAGLVEEMKPAVVVFENVANMARGEGSPFFEIYLAQLKEAGYESVSGIVNAMDYGVPQRRWRLLAISVLKKNRKAARKLSLPPKMKYSKEERRRYPWQTVRDAIGLLAPLEAGEADKRDPLHYARSHSVEVLNRIKKVPKNGGSRTDLPPEYWLPCHNALTRGGAHSVYGRMRWDEPAPTMTGRCVTPSCGRFLHPEQNRGITLREAARFQTIPDDVRNLKGGMDRVGKMIGDAVPVNLAERIALKVSELLSS